MIKVGSLVRIVSDSGFKGLSGRVVKDENVGLGYLVDFGNTPFSGGDPDDRIGQVGFSRAELKEIPEYTAEDIRSRELNINTAEMMQKLSGECIPIDTYLAILERSLACKHIAECLAVEGCKGSAIVWFKEAGRWYRLATTAN